MRKWVRQGRLVLLGVAQEQQADRCRLFAQWKRLELPIVHDPINLLGVRGVPVWVAVDEHGIVRSTGGKVSALEKEFLARKFPRPGPAAKPVPAKVPDLGALQRAVAKEATTRAWRAYGDALVLWKGAARVDDAIEAYSKALKLAPNDARSAFRLGVCHRMRHEAGRGDAADAGRAMALWNQARATDRRQYIWRRRVEQYSPPASRPYPFYDWTDQARREVAGRGEKPHPIARPPAQDHVKPPPRTP